MRNTFLESVILQRAEEQLSSLDFRSSKGHSEAAPLARCECGEVIPRGKNGGRPRKYCDDDCAADARRMRKAEERREVREVTPQPLPTTRYLRDREKELVKRLRFAAKHPHYQRDYTRKRAEARRAIMEQP